MTARNLTVVSAGLNPSSSTRLLADRLSTATRDELQLHGVDTHVETVELRDHAHDVVNNLLTGFPPAGLRPVVDALAGADGLIAVTPIFNASYSGLFKLFFDTITDDTLAGKPVLIAATGGTPRHSLALEHALRPMFTCLHATVVPTSVYAAAEDWAGAGAELSRRVRRAAAELAEQLRLREPAAPADPFALTSSFDELLARNQL
jgi:FMN reductase